MEFQLKLPWEERNMDVVTLMDADSTHLLFILALMALALGAGLIPNYRSK